MKTDASKFLKDPDSALNWMKKKWINTNGILKKKVIIMPDFIRMSTDLTGSR